MRLRKGLEKCVCTDTCTVRRNSINPHGEKRGGERVNAPSVLVVSAEFGSRYVKLWTGTRRNSRDDAGTSTTTSKWRVSVRGCASNLQWIWKTQRRNLKHLVITKNKNNVTCEKNPRRNKTFYVHTVSEFVNCTSSDSFARDHTKNTPCLRRYLVNNSALLNGQITYPLHPESIGLRLKYGDSASSGRDGRQTGLSQANKVVAAPCPSPDTVRWYCTCHCGGEWTFYGLWWNMKRKWNEIGKKLQNFWI